MNKKNLFLRSLYDFANSFVFITFLLYFSQRLVIDWGLWDFWYNAIFAIASIILLLTSPTLASFTDKYGGRKRFLIISTFWTLLGYWMATLFAYLGQPMILIAIFFLIGQYFYQLSFSFHNPLIEDVADISHRARASGISQFSNSFGQLMWLVLAIPFSSDRLQPLLPSIIAFFVLSLPMMIFFKEKTLQQTKLTLNKFTSWSKEFRKRLTIFFSASIAIPMLVSFFFFNDALITVSNNYSIYMERVFATPDTTKNIIMMIILIMSSIWWLSFWRIADKIWTLKSLKYILISRIILLPWLGILKSLTALIICSAILGFFMWWIRTVTRAYLSQILKTDELWYWFSFYTIFERFATFLGPLTRGGMISIFWTWELSYRITMISMVIYVIIGFLFIQFWKRNKHNFT